MFDIKPAVRKATPALIALWGPSGSGKTYSALLMARGLVGKKGKIGMVDTENRRGEFYAELAGGWDHLDLQPPFTPERYTEAFNAFAEQGYGCIIVDSMSHVWEGDGGVLDMANSATKADGQPMQGLAKWNKPKMAYKRMVNNLLRAPFHVIFCLRAKDGHEQTGSGRDSSIKKLGLMPISEKNFIFEMTVSVLLGHDHRPVFNNNGLIQCHPLIPPVKAPDEIWGAFKPNEFLDEDTGKMIAQWVSGGETVDFDMEGLKKVARDIATMGTDRLRQHWNGLTKTQQKSLLPNMEEFKAIAAEADKQAGENGKAESDDDPLTDPFTDPPANGGDGQTIISAG